MCLLLYATSALSLFWYAPQWLSYYNLLIGGLPGETALGMEPTSTGTDWTAPCWTGSEPIPDPGEKVEFAAGPWTTWS